jgi:uroporphyrinogen-III synthase
MTIRPVLLIRGSGNERDAQSFAARGIPTVSESFTRITPGEKEAALQLLELATQVNSWVIVTSRNGVDYWNRLVAPRSLAEVLLNNSRLKFAAIGPGSAAALKLLGISEVLTPLKQSSEGLLDLLGSYPASTAIMPVGNLAKNILSEGLRGKGWTIHTGVVYVNSPVLVLPEAVRGVERGDFSAVLLRSPSAVRAFAHFLPYSKIPLICGDNSTSDAARELRLNVLAVADDPSPETIANLVVRTLEE